ncbi:MAG: helix-turn-helix domain-containing protein [Candidatus Dojkabacteria bacterium]
MDNTIGRRIRFFRERAGMSQFDLEVEIGNSQGSLSRIESGQTNPSKETLGKISETLRLTQLERMYLLGFLDEPATKIQINAAVESISDYFDKENTYAYLLDDRYNLIKISKGFISLLNLPKLLLKFAIGRNMVEVVFNPRSPVHKMIKWGETENLGKHQVSRLAVEFGYLQSEPWMQELMERLEKYPYFKKAWEEVQKSGPLDYYSKEARTVKLDSGGKTITFVYHVEQLKDHPRFMIIEFTPVG